MSTEYSVHTTHAITKGTVIVVTMAKRQELSSTTSMCHGAGLPNTHIHYLDCLAHVCEVSQLICNNFFNMSAENSGLVFQWRVLDYSRQAPKPNPTGDARRWHIRVGSN
jgi:hypothetical protein